MSPAQKKAKTAPPIPSSLQSQRRAGLVTALDRTLMTGIAGLMFATPLLPTESAAATGNGALFIILWLVLLAIWCARELFSAEARIRWCMVDGAVLLLVGWHSLSGLLMIANESGHARPAINTVWQWIAFAAAYWLIRQCCDRPSRCRALLVIGIIQATFLSACGAYQYAYSLPKTRAHYRQASEPEKQQILRELGIGDVAPDSRARKLYENRLYSTEPMATFGLANSLAGVLATWIVVLSAMAISAWQQQSLRLGQLVALLIAAVLIAACLLLTKSRTGVIAMMAGFCLIAVFGRAWKRTWSWRLPVVAAAVVMALVAGGFVTGILDVEVLSEAPKSLLYRLEYWQASAAMIRQYPVLGCGPGNFQLNYTHVMLPQSSEVVADPHNFVFEIWATAGSPALIALLLIFVAIIRTAGGRNANRPDHTESTAREETGLGDNQALTFSIQGAVVGLLLAFPVAIISGLSLDLGMVAVATVVAVVCGIGMVNPLRNVSLRPAIATIGLIVLLINLLAAGGIGFAGVALSGWILLALAVNLVRPTHPAMASPKPLLAALLAGSLLLIAWCQQSMVLPVTQANARIQQGVEFVSRGQLEPAARSLAEATQIDPYNSDYWRQRAQVGLQRWQITGSNSDWQAFHRWAQESIRRNPRSSQNYRYVGQLYLVAFQHRRSAEARQQAIESYQQAVECHPNNSFLHAQLAWVYHIAGQEEKAAQHAARALQLDELNPHSDLKLKRQSLDVGNRSKPGLDTEQLMQQLRKRNKGSSHANGAVS